MKPTQRSAARKIKKIGNATEEEWNKIQQSYAAAVEGMKTVGNPILILLCIVGIAMVIYFHSSLLDFLGLLVFAYALYAFAGREGHRNGYLEGYYDAMSQGKKKAADVKE